MNIAFGNGGAGSLLTIDVASEIRLLGAAQLQGVWLLPTELVRYAVARGARKVQVNLSRSGFEVSDDGRPIAVEALEGLVTALDESRQDRVRHDALEIIEKSHNLPLLWAATLADRAIRISTSRNGESLAFQISKKKVNLERTPRDLDALGVRVTGSAKGWSAGRAIAAIQDRCRFVPAELEVNGSTGQQGFPDGLFRSKFEHPLRGIVATTKFGDSPRLWLLQHGVLSSRATIPRYPPFEAAVELGSRAELGSSPSEQRAAVTPYLSEIVDHALTMLILLGRRPEELDDIARLRVSEVLLDAASRNLRRDEILELPLFPGYLASEGPARWTSIGRLRRAGKVVVPVAKSASEVYESAFQGDGTLVIPVRLRARVSELAEIKLEEPARSKRKAALGDRLKRLGTVFLNWAARRRQLHHTGGILPESRLEPHEIEGLEQLRARLSSIFGDESLNAFLCTRGSAPVRRGRKILIPRSPQAQRALTRASKGESGVLYPLLVAAVGNEIELPAQIRRQWIENITASGRKKA
jgi:hypothetical protein